MTRLARPCLALALLAAPLAVAGCGGSRSNNSNNNKDATPIARDGSSVAPDVAGSPKPDANLDLASVAPADGPAVVLDAAADNRPAAVDSGPTIVPDAAADARPVTVDGGPAVVPDAATDSRSATPDSRPVGLDSAVDNRPVTIDSGPVVASDASVPPGSGTVLESASLRLEVTASPYSYKVIEKSSSEVLVSQSASTFTVGGTASNTASASGFSTTATTLDATLALSGGSNTAHVKFTFTSPEVLQVLLTSSNGTPTNVKEQFNDQSEHYYGIWGYHLGSSGNLDNRGADADLLGLQTNSDINYSSARAPFYATSKKYGIYAESVAKGHYTIAVSNKTSFNFDSPQLQYDIIYGPTYADILGRYNTLAGPSFMPPIWAFDSIWWRDDHHADWAAQGVTSSQALVIKDADNLRLNQIPASAIWIDRPYSSPLGQTGKAGAWGNMDFDSTFPNPSQMITDLNTRGMKLILWTANRCFDQLLTEAKASNYNFAVGTYGDSPAADVRIPAAYTWFKSKLDAFVKLGVRGYKIDRGEEGEQPDSAQNENVYLFHKLSYEGMAVSNANNDFLIFARNVFDKSRQYSGHWSGDPTAGFAGLIGSIKVGLRAGAMNFPIFGSDTGGYNGTPNSELLARWLQFNAYTSMMEVLIGPNRTMWTMNDPALVKIAQTQTQAHHDLIPYTRSYAYKATQTGMPIMRAMILAYPGDASLVDTWNQYMYGGEILVAPVTTAGGTSRSVYLPAGNWIDYNDKATTYVGGKSVTSSAPLATIPLFVKEGAIVPRGDILKSNNNWTTNWAANLRIEVFPAASASSSFDYYTGSGVQTISASLSSGTLTVQFGDLGTDGKLEVYCNGYSSVTRNGVGLTSGSDFTYDSTKKLLTVSYSGATNLQIAGTASVF